MAMSICVEDAAQNAIHVAFRSPIAPFLKENQQ